MPETKKEHLIAILQTLKKIGEVLGSSVISRDGLVIASDLSTDVDEETFAAMSAAMQGADETAVSELKQGNLKQIIIDYQNGKIIIISAGEKAILVILAKSKINLGLALLEMGKTGKKIDGVLGWLGEKMPLEVAEIIALIIILICFVFMITAAKADKKWQWLTAGVSFLFLEQIFTNLEAFWWNVGFNFLEHFSAMIGCAVFAVACYGSYKRSGGGGLK